MKSTSRGQASGCFTWRLPVARVWGAATILLLGAGTIPVSAQSKTDVIIAESYPVLPKPIQDGIAEEPQAVATSSHEAVSQAPKVDFGPDGAEGISGEILTVELTEIPDYLICRHAVEWWKARWVKDPPSAPYVSEARRRQLTINDCFTIVPISSAGGAGVEKAIDVRVCSRALNSKGADWETRSAYSNYVAAAKQRNLSISTCREALALAALEGRPKKTDLRRLDTSIVCVMSFEPKTGGSSRWQMKPPQDSYVVELKRRYTTEARCRELLGI